MKEIKTKVSQGESEGCNNELESSRMTEMVRKASGILGMHKEMLVMD